MANNPNVNKVVYGNQTVMDITDTTAEAADVAEGEVFYDRSGARSVGTATSNYYSPDDTTETTLANILDDADLVPFYDTSATAKKNSTWANIKTKLADVFRKKIIGIFNGAGNSAYYCLLCTLHIDYARIDGATEIIIQERGRKTVARLNVLFASSADTDPDLQSFTVIGGQKNYFIAKSDTSTWQIYVTKSEPYSVISVIGFSPYIRQTGEVSVSVTWNLENASTLPSGRVQASYEHTLADFDDDSTHRLVTDTEKSTWNGITSLATVATSGSYTDLSNKPDTSKVYQFEYAQSAELPILLKPSNAPYDDTAYSRQVKVNPVNGELIADVLNGARIGNNPKFTDTTYDLASKTQNGLMRALPDETTTTKYMRQDGTWQVPPNTTYSSKAAASGGTEVSLCTTGEKYTWNNKSSVTSRQTPASGGTTLSLVNTGDMYNWNNKQKALSAPTAYIISESINKTVTLATGSNDIDITGVTKSGYTALCAIFTRHNSVGSIYPVKCCVPVSSGTVSLTLYNNSGASKSNVTVYARVIWVKDAW